MNRDLEDTLNEMGPECRAVVARLRAAREVTPRTGGTRRRGGWLVAASLLVLAGVSSLCLTRPPRPSQRSSFPREYHASVDEMIVTQNADGSWQNDFLTRRNAAALKPCGDPAAQIAYKKAMRNLRLRGVL